MRKLGIVNEGAREFVCLYWQERFTESASAADLLTWWGLLLLAEGEDWPQRAQTIGKLLFDMLETEGFSPPLIGRLHSLI